jgi:hypothetical protein
VQRTIANRFFIACALFRVCQKSVHAHSPLCDGTRYCIAVFIAIRLLIFQLRLTFNKKTAEREKPKRRRELNLMVTSGALEMSERQLFVWST